MVDHRMSAKVRITGRVQGVFFRAWARDEAERLGLDGWVRNEHDGSVTALIAGSRESVEAMIGLLQRGPPEARVAKVAVDEADPAEVSSGFHVRH